MDSNGRKQEMRPWGAFTRPGVIATEGSGANPTLSSIRNTAKIYVMLKLNLNLEKYSSRSKRRPC